VTSAVKFTRKTTHFILHLHNQKSLLIILPNVKCSQFLQSQCIYLIQYLSLQLFSYISIVSVTLPIYTEFGDSGKNTQMYKCFKEQNMKGHFALLPSTAQSIAWENQPELLNHLPVERKHFLYCPRMCEDRVASLAKGMQLEEQE